MTDDEINERAEKVKALSESVYGRVVCRDGCEMEIEIPADLSPHLYPLWSKMSVGVSNVGQTTRMARRRIRAGEEIIQLKDEVTTAFHVILVDLDGPKPQSAENIMTPRTRLSWRPRIYR